MSTRRLHVLRRLSLLLVLLLTGLQAALPASAQDGTGNSGTTIHVVQRDETLFRIALRYGTSVEAIADANGISDPRYLTVGQRLLIPYTGANVAGTVMLHTVTPGETLHTLAQQFGTTPETLAQANYITNPAQVFVGQAIAIPVTDEPQNTAVARALHHVQQGENLPRIATRYNVPLADLLLANGMAQAMPVFAGQALWIPGGDSSLAVRDLPAPFTEIALSPIPAIQGKTMSIALKTSEYITLTGTFMGYPVQIVTQDATQHFALFGIHAFAEAGVYPLLLTATTADGMQTTLSQRVRIDLGGYGAEAIALAAGQESLLTPEVTEPEWERFARLMSSFTAQRYFDGVMGLPSSGAISSQFGTRRSYNGGALSTFHSGTDFAGAPGSPIVAPAGGVVIMAEALPVRGNTTIIDHGWGVVTAYFHQTDIQVGVGSVVSAGQTIGTIGSTGRSTGPHLHWEMWVGGVQVDPMQWVQRSFP